MFGTTTTTNKVIEKFQKLERIGKGSYAVVFKAKEKDTNQIVALKKYILQDDEDNGIPESSLRELAILKMCNHPNIIEMLWYDNNNFRYFSMRPYRFDLKKYLRNVYGTTPLETVRDLSYQILRGLYYLHSYGIAHRDIKPHNILVHTIEGKVTAVIIDAGAGRRFDIVNRECPKSHIVCTLWYRSPEILLGYKHYYYEIDVWSVGCVIAEMMTKKAIFPGDSEIDQLYKIFQVFGTPNNQNWKGVSELPDYKTIFPKWENKYRKKYTSDKYDPTLLDLIETALTMDPLSRPRIDQLLFHPFFETVPDYITNAYEDNNITDHRDKWVDNMTTWEIPALHTSMIFQNDITLRIRIILLDWLGEVCSEYLISTSSYLRAQNILDRYTLLSLGISRSNYQLIGSAVLLIAVKIEEVYPCDPSDLVYISDNTYTVSQLVSMEKKILKVLDLDIFFPITTNFLALYVQRMKLDEIQKIEVIFILRYITCCLDLMKYHPSVLCLCACLYVSGQTDLVYSNSPDTPYSPADDEGEAKMDISGQNNTIEPSDDISECMDKMKNWLGNGFKNNMNSITTMLEWKINGKYPKKLFLRKYQ